MTQTEQAIILILGFTPEELETLTALQRWTVDVLRLYLGLDPPDDEQMIPYYKMPDDLVYEALYQYIEAETFIKSKRNCSDI